MPEEKSEKGIIKIIGEMLREGETEDKIIKTLQGLGAKDDEAKRMLLVAQAHTFDQLKSEIGRIIETQISGDKPILREIIKSQIEEAARKRMFAEETKTSGKKQGFFSRIFRRLFGGKAREEKLEKITMPEIPASETKKGFEEFAEQAISGEPEAISPEMERLEGVSEKIREEPGALKENLKKIRSKITRLESWQARYQRELNQLKHAQEEKKLSEEQTRKKSQLTKKIRDYKMQIALLSKVSSAKENLEMEQIATEQAKGQIIFREETKSPLELKTMTDLAEAAKAITLAAASLARASPKPKIVIESHEEMLSTDQQIDQMKRMQKRLEIDFYKRRIPLQDFQEKVMDYQAKLYELEEKKKILEKTKAAPKGREKRLSKELEKTIEQKLSGRVSDEKIMEIENYIVELLNNYKMPEKKIVQEIKPLDSSQLLASLEKLAKMNELQRQAEQEIEKKGFQFPWLTKQKEEEKALPGQATAMQETSPETQPQTTSTATQTGTTATGQLPAMQKSAETPKEKIIAVQAPAPNYSKISGITEEQTALPQEEIEVQTAKTTVPAQQAKKGFFGGIFRRAQKKESQQTTNVQVNEALHETIIQKEEQVQKNYEAKIEEPIEIEKPGDIEAEKPLDADAGNEETEKTSREEGWASRSEELEEMGRISAKVEGMQRPKKELHIRALPITRFFKKTSEEPRRVIIEPGEVGWSEAEIPTFPTTLENKEKEKLKTNEKEIMKFRIETDMDLTLQIIREKGKIRTGELWKETKIEKKRLEELLNILEDQHLIKVEYPAFGDTIIESADYVKPSKPKKEKKIKKEKSLGK
ncbi:MAG: hypothetical protein PHD95_02345 [Candidatus ainarchaeum sp.]|nr:hypothetical protein [Candidatus ainarchaeum sp.]